MPKLRYLAQARDDLIQIRRYIADRTGDDDLALGFVGKLREQCRRLAELPGRLGRARPELHEDLRSFPYGNYVIFFIYNEDCIDIVTIIQGHRDVDTLFGDS
jgi:plasmid stabilization system protein ParE